MQLAFNLLGILVVFGICWLLSWQRKSINWKLIGKAFVIQLLFLVSALDCSLFVRILFLVCFSFSGIFSTFAIQNQ